MIRITFNAPGLFAEALSQFDRGLAADQVLMLDDFERLDRLSAWCAEKEPAALLLHRVTAGGAARGKLGTIVRNCIGIIRVCVEGAATGELAAHFRCVASPVSLILSIQIFSA